MLSGSARAKAAHRTLMKLTPGVCRVPDCERDFCGANRGGRRERRSWLEVLPLSDDDRESENLNGKIITDVRTSLFADFLFAVKSSLEKYRWTSLYVRDRDSKNMLEYNEFEYKKTKD